MLLEGTVQAASTHVPKPYVYPSLSACLDAMETMSLSGLTRQSFGQKIPAQAGTDASQKSAPLKLALDNVDPKESLSAFLSQTPPKGRQVLAAIGSERGWSPAERSLLEARGFVRLGMGSRVMRTETACTVSASIILSSIGTLG